MVDRIKVLMSRKNISATQFSEEVGVQRSALSHVLSGRNKPSLDFMLKIKKRYPEVDLDWLLLGHGKMTKEQIPTKNSKELIEKEGGQTEMELPLETNKTDLVVEEHVPVEQNDVVSDEHPVRYRKVGSEKPSYILLVYSDNTFETMVERQ